jgi:ribosomal protein L29
MKALVELRKNSNDQLNNKLREIDVSLRRVRGYIHGACAPPQAVNSVKHKTANQGQSEDTMYYHKLKREKAQILTILSERRLGINSLDTKDESENK